MPIAAHLLGPPLMIRDGVVYAPPKGKKVWALLAYLVLSDRPPTRSQLVELLFPDAEDPAGALRWNLSELRRLLGGPDTVGSGNAVHLRLPEGSVIDVHVLMAGTSFEAVELPGLGRELLEGVEVEASAGFAAWLLGERRRLQALGGSVLREGALRALAAGDARTAVELATRMVAADPLNEDAHALLIRAFAGTGDEVAVQRQLSASVDLFRRELGVEPGPELAEAAVARVPRAAPVVGAGPPALRALIESGEAAVNAGAIEAGLESLRNAVAASRGAGATEEEAAALLALGSALVHSTKGKDEEGAAALHRCIAAAEATGRPALAASAHRELGYVEVLRGDYPRALDVAPSRGGARRRRRARDREHPRGDRGRPRRHRRARAGRDGLPRGDRAGGVGRTDEAGGVATGGPRPNTAAAQRARARGGIARTGTRAEPERAVDGVPRLPRGAARRGVGPAGATWIARPRRSSTRSHSGHRWTTPAGRRTRSGGSGSCTPRAAIWGAAVEAMETLAHHVRPPARHPSVGPRVRAGRPLRRGRRGASSDGERRG